MNIEKISKITLWVLMGISAIIFILFFVVNFDNKWEENPKMNDPQRIRQAILAGVVLSGFKPSRAYRRAVSFLSPSGSNGRNKKASESEECR